MSAADRFSDLRAGIAAAASLDDLAGEVERRARRYCGEHGIPQSVFFGRAITERTTVTYRRDDDGNLVVTRVTERDPEWLPEDLEAALRYQAEQDALCSACGQPRGESFDGANRYEVITHRCDACAAIGQRSWQAHKNRPKNGPPPLGIYYGLKKV